MEKRTETGLKKTAKTAVEGAITEMAAAENENVVSVHDEALEIVTGGARKAIKCDKRHINGKPYQDT